MKFSPKVEVTGKQYDIIREAMEVVKEFCNTIEDCDDCPCRGACNDAMNQPPDFCLEIIYETMNPTL